MNSVRAEFAPDPGFRTRPFSVAEYHRMLDAGILGEDDHVELLEGAVVEVSPQGERHARVIQRLTHAFVRGLGDAFVVRPQLPLTFRDSEPEPDLAVVRAEDAASPDEHPSRALLVVEVSRASLAHDRSVKARVYARAGVAEFWIVNTVDRVVEVHRDPDELGARYRTILAVGEEETLAPAGLPGFSLSVATLFD